MRPPAGRPRPPAVVVAAPPAAPVDRRAGRVLGAVGWEPTSFNRVVARAGMPISEVVAVLEELADGGAVAEERGWWQRLR